MIRDITIGQFYPADSKLHRLDPRVKITMVFAYILSLLVMGNHLFYYFMAAAFLGLIIKISKIPFRYMIKGLKSIIIIILFTVIISLFTTPGEYYILNIGVFKITVEGVLVAFKMAFRLVLLIIGSSLLTLATSPIDLTDAIEKLLKPLEKIKVPAHEIAMMMTIALRFIPILLEETDKIMKAQMARGADFESGGLIKKAKNLIPLLVPLFISAFRRADELALAMEARCYRGGEGRTRMKQLKYMKKDYFAFLLLILYLVFMFVFARLIGQVQVYGILL